MTGAMVTGAPFSLCGEKDGQRFAFRFRAYIDSLVLYIYILEIYLYINGSSVLRFWACIRDVHCVIGFRSSCGGSRLIHIRLPKRNCWPTCQARERVMCRWGQAVTTAARRKK